MVNRRTSSIIFLCFLTFGLFLCKVSSSEVLPVLANKIEQANNFSHQKNWQEAAAIYQEILPSLNETSKNAMLPTLANTFYQAGWYHEAAVNYVTLVNKEQDLSSQKMYLEKLAASYTRSYQFKKAIQTILEYRKLV